MKYELVWKDGSRNTVEGQDIEDAFTKAGFGAGAIPALDYFRPLDVIVDIPPEKEKEEVNSQ
jgi:hypothetical protein